MYYTKESCSGLIGGGLYHVKYTRTGPAALDKLRVDASKQEEEWVGDHIYLLLS